MKRLSIFLVALASLVALDAWACDRDHKASFLSLSCDASVRLAERCDIGDADLAIFTENRKVVLLLTDRVVAMQLSDRVLHRLDRKMQDADDEDENHVLGRVIKNAVLASVRTVLKHSAQCDIRDIRSADYRNGELILIARNGERIFADTEVDDDDVMRNFKASDAREFVRELRRRIRER